MVLKMRRRDARSPYEDALVRFELEDRFLKTQECVLAFSIHRRHVHAEETNETICPVFDLRRVPFGSPTHALSHRHSARFRVARQDLHRDLR